MCQVWRIIVTSENPAWTYDSWHQYGSSRVCPFKMSVIVPPEVTMEQLIQPIVLFIVLHICGLVMIAPFPQIAL